MNKKNKIIKYRGFKLVSNLDCNMVKITLSEIEQFLWGAANILRGPVDASDFKAYIFPLLFFKRISDIYDEEFENALKESGGDKEYASYPEQHDYQIPEGAHWNDVRAKTVNVGQVLQFAFREIEKANPDQLYGIFGDVNWSNKEKLSDELLVNLIEHFSSINLSTKNANPDMLGEAYEYLIKKFADLTNRKAGEFYTPRSIVHLIGSILKPKEKETIYDPACGSGGMLLEAYNLVKQTPGSDARTIKLYGQEKNLTTSAIARINLFIHGIKDFKIVRGDTLRDPTFREGDNLAKFDVVIANPPFSLKNWGYEMWPRDPFGRNFAGTPPKSYGDYAWVQHMITSMAKHNGRVGVVLPHGALFRQGVETIIRKKLIDSDLLETVIGLGPNLFYGTGISACILIFKNNKDSAHKEKVYFIDASELYQKGRNKNYFLDVHVNKVIEWYNQFSNIEGVSKIVDIKDIEKNDYNLNISRYVKKKKVDDGLTLKEVFNDLKKAQSDWSKSDEEVNRILKEMKLL